MVRNPAVWGAPFAAVLVSALGAASQGTLEIEDRVRTGVEGRYRVECEVRIEGARELAHGLWRRFAEKDGQGEPLAEGRWVDGRLEGPWIWRHADGSPAMKGSYAAGRRDGDWEFFHPGGAPAARGSYVHGLREGQWHEFTPDGARDPAHAGLYNLERAHWPERSARLRASLRGGERHGEFHGFWRDGESPRVVGRYVEGRPSGWWSFWLVDGTLDPEILTGWYEGGEAVADHPRPHPRELWEDPYEERAQQAALAEGRVGALPSPGRHARGITAARRNELQALLQGYAAGDGAPFEELLAAGRPLGSDVLRLLLELDLAEDADVARGQALTTLLAAIAGGRGFPWRAASDADARAANHLARVRWLSWWELVRDDDGWWQRRERGEFAADEPLLGWELLTGQRVPLPALPPGPRAAGAPIAPIPPFPGTRRDELDLRDALRWALGWLLAHQGEDGAWSCAGFSARCADVRSGACDGAGRSVHDVGVSGLALLALMAEGRTAGLVLVEEAVDRGLGALLRAQADEGLIGARRGKDFVYDHAIATVALAQGLRYTARADLTEPLERAVAFILRGRNPNAGWRYDVPPIGESDTSVSAWMVAAIVAAAEAGVPADDAALEGARLWLEAVTDVETGRVGYLERGSRSARVIGINDHYAIDRTEAMTAAGLMTRILLGQGPRSEPLLPRHAELLRRALPTWDRDGLTNAFYYWFYGTRALYELRVHDAAAWTEWAAALRPALLASQRQTGHARGSWDPIGPWGFAGGRIYSTALAALMLERLYAASDPPTRRR